MRRLLGTAVLALALPLLATGSAQAGASHHPRTLHWQERDLPSAAAGLRGLDAVDRRTAYVGSDDGHVWRTTTGGRSWTDVSPAGSADLAFRDVEAFSRRHVAVLAIGEGDASRVYVTRDAGRTWRATFVNQDPDAFYDCMAFFPDGRRGVAMSDPVDGKFRILATRNGGQSWHVMPSRGMPAAVTGEAGFAASGTCIATAGRHDVYFGSGGAASRIFHSRNGGRTWSVTTSPIPATASGGVFSLAFRGPRHGVAVGGDYVDFQNGVDGSARTRDGRHWVSGGDLGGYRSGVAWVPRSRRTLLAVGTSGSDVSRDGGRSWTTFDTGSFNSVVCVADRSCWAAGPDGRVARMTHVR